MKKFIAALLFILPQNAMALPTCDDVAADLISKTGAAFVRKSPAMGNIFLSHPAATDLVVFCGGASLSVAIAKDGAPTGDYLRLATVAARIVTASDDPGLPAALAACLKKARRSKDEMAEGSTSHVSYDCQSFARDGGGNHISVGANKHLD